MMNEEQPFKRMSAKRKAKFLLKTIRQERPDYFYLRDLFRELRKLLSIEVNTNTKRLPYVPTEREMKKYYDTIWKIRNPKHIIIIKLFLYTGARVSELINMTLEDVDFDRCQIRINNGKGGKDRIVPFPSSFKETLALHVAACQQKGGKFLFESSWRRPYTDRGIRKIMWKYTDLAGMSKSISPHKLRHFLFTWLKKQGIEDAFIQPYSGHSSRKALEVYSRLSLSDAQKQYDKVIERFPI